MKNLLILLTSLVAAALPAQAQPSAKAFYDGAMRLLENRNVGYGEQFCWFVHFNGDIWTMGYQAYGDEAWIQYGQQYFDYAISKMQLLQG